MLHLQFSLAGNNSNAGRFNGRGLAVVCSFSSRNKLHHQGMELVILLLALAKLGLANPTNPPVAGGDFTGLSLVESVATIAAMMSKPDGIVQPIKGTPKDLLSCVDPKHLIPYENLCLDNLMEDIQSLPPVGNCSLADAAGAAPDNSINKVFNLTLAIASLEETTTLSPDQILSAAKSMGQCIESNFTLFQLLPESLVQQIQTNITATEEVTHRFGVKRKFEDRYNRLRVALCVLKGVIQNGCSEVEARWKSAALREQTVTNTDDFSGEFLADDDDSREEELDLNW